jgi:hypothetical protein
MRINKKDQLKWEQHCLLIQNMTSVNVFEKIEDKEARIEKAKNNYEFFVEYYFPHYARSKCANFQIEAAELVAKNKKLRAVFEWHRGAAKSTHFNILIPLWLKIKGELKVMLLIGKSQESAAILLEDCKAELQFNERYKNDFGEQIGNGTWEIGRFVTKDEIAFFSLGRGQSPRGLRYRQNRPNYITMDDIDSEDIIENISRVNKLVEWVLSALLPASDMGNSRFICVGNRISKNSVLAKLCEIPGIHHSVINAIAEDGLPSWREKYTKEEILEVKETIGTRLFEKEYCNNPTSEGGIFKAKHIHYLEMNDMSIYRYLICYTDPSFKSGSKNDFKATALIALTAKGQYHVLKVFCEQTTVSNLVHWHYVIGQEFNGLPIHYYMEANFIQDLIFQEFLTEGEKYGQIPIMPDKRAKPDKMQRIESMQPIFERGLIFFNEKEKNSLGMKTGIEQLLMCERGVRFHDDFPDALEGGISLLNTKIKTDAPIIIGKRSEVLYNSSMRY